MNRFLNFLSRYFRLICPRAYHWILAFLRLQIVLFLVTLPILSAWGFPLSKASIIGNLLFAPFATLFLGLAALWFLCHPCSFPTAIIVYCLERLVSWWMWGLSWGSSSMLFTVPSAHPIVLVLIPFTAFLVLFSSLRSRWGLEGEVLTLSMLGLLWCMGLKTYATANKPVPLAHGGGTMWLIPRPEGVALVDTTGVLRKVPPSSSWITFTLSTTLAKCFGANACKDIVIMKPTFQRLSAAANLIRIGKAECLVVPNWITDKKWWLKWREANSQLKAKNINENELYALYFYGPHNSGNLDFDSPQKRCNTKGHLQ